MSANIPVVFFVFEHSSLASQVSEIKGWGSELQMLEFFSVTALTVEWRRGVEGEEKVWREAFHVPGGGEQHYHTHLSEEGG